VAGEVEEPAQGSVPAVAARAECPVAEVRVLVALAPAGAQLQPANREACGKAPVEGQVPEVV